MMEEISYKLKSGNSLLVVSAVEKLLGGVRGGGAESEALRILRDACGSPEPAVALAACQGLLSLAESGVVSPAHTMSTMLAMLPSAESYTAVISTICGLLMLELCSPTAEYVCRFLLKCPQHPLVTVLETSPAAAEDVLGQMEALCHHPHYTISENSVELLRAVFLWLVCHPSEQHSLRWRPHCWRLLLSLKCRGQPTLLRECVLWQQVSNPKHLQAAFSVYSALADSALHQNNTDYVIALVPALARMSNHFIQQRLDPRPCYTCIDRCLAACAAPLQQVAGLTLALLAENVSSSPALYLHSLYALCQKIIAKYEVPSISLSVLVSHSLQWLHNPSHLTAEALKVIANLLDIHRNGKPFDNRLHMASLLTNQFFEELIHADKRLFFVFEQFHSWEHVRTENSKIEEWLNGIDTVHHDMKQEFVPLLLGVLVEEKLEEGVILKAMKICLDVTKANSDLAVLMLPVLLYKVANDTRPNVRLQCLKAIPLMATCKANVPGVVAFLGRVRASRGAPQSLLLALHASLVRAQVRCYPYLQELLLDAAGLGAGELRWEADISRAAAVVEICQTRAGTYGAELVSVISGLLNRCTEPAGGIASALALDALRTLWRERVVAPPSTWYALAPKMTRDKRPAVHVGLCKLLAEVPLLRAQSADYDKLVADAARTLWGYVAGEHDARVAAAACDALAGYRLEEYTLRELPDVYRRGVKLPAALCKTPLDAARQPEDVLDYIPGEIWPMVFKNTNESSLPGVERLVAALVAREVRGYRSGVYRRDAGGASEPEHLHYLPPHSVVRGVLEYLRRQALSPTYDCSEAALLALVRSVTRRRREAARPLPPLDMCFLHELFHRGRHCRQPALLLAARQALISVSAKRFLENYLTAAEPADGEEEEIMEVFDILDALCCSVPPAILRVYLQKNLSYAHSRMPESACRLDKAEAESLLFVRHLRTITECLKDEKIHDANRTLLSQLVESYWGIISDDSVAWEAYEAACCELSAACLERITSPSSWWEASAAALRRATLVRARLAAADLPAPLVWLNEIVGAAVVSPSEHAFVLRAIAAPLATAPADADTRDWLLQLMGKPAGVCVFDCSEHAFVLRAIAAPLATAPADADTRDWLLQLMARVQTAIADSPEDTTGLAFLCDVLMLSVVSMSGAARLAAARDGGGTAAESRALRCRLFPSAAGSLVGAGRPTEWRDCAAQLIEWLQHTRTVRSVPGDCRASFYRALVACRHTDHYSRHGTWARVLSVRPDV